MSFPYQIVMMYRYGETGDHGYFLCAKKLREDLIEEAKKEYKQRGHKYEPYILTLNDKGYCIKRERVDLSELT